ncbi:hypothetical protein [Mesorhizobium sp. 113-3-3]|uniref:hypothetical protein n=1 Tax=Mesorhizobium sp. 113-3-3 TaxID=2744516 RepID=UPI0019276C2F|nr:hypothetical protein [Mesorhizobium sp. 113-3-3]
MRQIIELCARFQASLLDKVFLAGVLADRRTAEQCKTSPAPVSSGMIFPCFWQNPEISVREACNQENAGKKLPGRPSQQTLLEPLPIVGHGQPILGDDKLRRTIEKTAQPLYNLRKRARCVIRHGQISTRAHSVPSNWMCRIELLENSEPET